MLERFPEEYGQYCRRTPRFFPRPGSLLRLRDFIPLKWDWLKSELRSLGIFLFVVFAIEVWEDTVLFGYDELVKETLELLGLFSLFTAVFIFIRMPKDHPVDGQ